MPDRIQDGAVYLAQPGSVTQYRPTIPVRGVVLFLSGDGGWNQGVIDLAQSLAKQGIAVAGISTLAFRKALETSADRCTNPNFALLALAQDFEHEMGLDHYLKPIILGYSTGATIGYAALAQAPTGAYRGGIAIGFSPDVSGIKPWCPANGFTPVRIHKPATGWLFSPTPHLPVPWIVLQGVEDRVVSASTAGAFAARIPQAQYVELYKVGHSLANQAPWLPALTAALAPMLEAPVRPVMSPDTVIARIDDLPVTPVPAPAGAKGDLMAVLYSGDGGWAGLDRDIAAQLAARGIPVVGVDSLAYFWTAKTPAQAGSDLGRIINHFSQQWQRPRVLLIGHSFGADDLPFIAGAMPPALRPAIGRISLLGLGPAADFQFHLASWLDVGADNGWPTVPEIVRNAAMPIQCIRGAEETGSACPAIPHGIAVQAVLPGGHHLDGNASLIVSTILQGIRT